MPNEKKLQFVLDPDLGDGITWQVVDDPKIVAEILDAWREEAGDCDRVTIGLREMSKAEVDALPEL